MHSHVCGFLVSRVSDFKISHRCGDAAVFNRRSLCSICYSTGLRPPWAFRAVRSLQRGESLTAFGSSLGSRTDCVQKSSWRANAWQAVMKSAGVTCVVALNKRWKWKVLNSADLAKDSNFRLPFLASLGCSNVTSIMLRRTREIARTLVFVVPDVSGVQRLHGRNFACRAASTAPGKEKNTTCFLEGRGDAHDGRQKTFVVKTPYRKKRSAARDRDSVACRRWSFVSKPLMRLLVAFWGLLEIKKGVGVEHSVRLGVGW